jgi:hypothetical protein
MKLTKVSRPPHWRVLILRVRFFFSRNRGYVRRGVLMVEHLQPGPETRHAQMRAMEKVPMLLMQSCWGFSTMHLLSPLVCWSLSKNNSHALAP